MNLKLKKFLAAGFAAALGASFVAERPADAQLDKQFRQEATINCDKSNAQFARFFTDGPIDGYACVFGNWVYNRNVKYSNSLCIQSKGGRPCPPRKPVGYYDLNKAFELNKQSIGDGQYCYPESCGTPAPYGITLYKNEPDGIVKYFCNSDDGATCAGRINREIQYKRL